MKKISILLSFLFLTALVFAQDVTRSYQVAQFSGISAGSVFDVKLTKSSVNTISTTADAEVSKYIVVKVKNGVLYLELDTDRMPFLMRRNIKYVKANITITQLDKVYLSGAARLRSSGIFSPDSFKGDFSGAATAEGLNINAEISAIQVSGASKLEIKSKSRKVKYDLSGASVVTIDQESSDINLDGSGASKMDFIGSSEKIVVSISGATKVKMKGSATTAIFEASGASQLDAEYFIVQDAKVEASGVSNVRTNVTRTLSAEISGGSALRYLGNPTMKNIETSSQASIQRINSSR